ncbi:hypothetical protein [Carboxylicivirga sp. M1479]|uniref:hypothetical protein n=1 Tax=Carboxylicivirga sp. M1479 TaxID=2594476 RepID=UPI0011773E57|nr:hypothetical protein [Carboxylicivirga sp. M1479]TRX70855.1 hypothetical protein FNN09_09335 [Carboxylicivirga sp. M1479]
MEIRFDNKKRAKSISNVLSLVVMLVILAIGLNYLWFETTDKAIEVSLWLALVVIIVLYYIGGFCYVEFMGNDSKLEVKYYNLFPFWREYKRIVLPIERLKSMKVRAGLGILGRGLSIYGRISGRLAMFPTVGLSALSKSQLDELKQYAASVSK